MHGIMILLYLFEGDMKLHRGAYPASTNPLTSRPGTGYFCVYVILVWKQVHTAKAVLPELGPRPNKRYGRPIPATPP